MNTKPIKNVKIDIKTISTNSLYQGRKILSQSGKDFKEVIKLELMQRNTRLNIDLNKPLFLFLKVGFSNLGSDLSNSVKAFEDAVSEFYGYNDNKHFRIFLQKEKTKKGKEFIEFNILQDENVEVHIVLNTEKGKYKII